MPIESRQGPLYFHAVQNDKYRKNFDKIFRKKAKKPKMSNKPKTSSDTQQQVDNT